MLSLKDLSFEELERYVQNMNLERYRAHQIAQWLYKKFPDSYMDMTNLPMDLRKSLSDGFILYSLKEVERLTSADGTQKFLFETGDGEHVESVLIPDDDRLTLCISTQIGCRMGCRFCLTGRQGFKRNLSCSEIVDQILLVQKAIDRRITNIVIMGMGEPLDNYENVTKAVSIITDDRCIGVSYRKVTLSTVGLLPQLERLLKEGPRVTLSISINAPSSEIRAEVMPIEKKYPMEQIIALLKQYTKNWRKPPTIEYVMLKGINDSVEDASNLASKLKGLRCKINLIPFNPWPGSLYERPEDDDVSAFQQALIDKGFSVFIRKSRGQDILAACGQLRWKYMGSN
ncbi:23S rRNA (adenine2503-C2)-methyltransferase [Thermosulfidibacter takaii ABI70S6]|uniref:Probable dual-specificity RNA methyltransferase RlmN n=1 Tax=Thermosulfidibacter takaii (strain DSM 17441 / JCM 13301 / NBRC 103674 / ABI70S6) TaxID=1298851 RepID=A0A0S3QTR2_THET7|nr:23S rRNA (adenine(2503)-C(2))-methyltransferase RlmN [Thermosulfidibacter takaii]BAT71730.1 23S rRNA (adenine2503-C2)-methyltransferase [Thermosulfidibacter takaii ABI70S6]